MIYIALTQGKCATIDEQDTHLVRKYSPWQFHVSSTGRTGYAITYIPLLDWRETGVKKRQFRVFMHDIIMMPPTGVEVDHRDGDGTNNCRGNLRNATRQQQCQNRSQTTSGYKGVSSKTYLGGIRWHAHLQVEGKQMHVGTYNSPEEAAIAYNSYAIFFYGEFARLNSLPPSYPQSMSIPEVKVMTSDRRRRP